MNTKLKVVELEIRLKNQEETLDILLKYINLISDEFDMLMKYQNLEIRDEPANKYIAGKKDK